MSNTPLAPRSRPSHAFLAAREARHQRRKAIKFNSTPLQRNSSNSSTSSASSVTATTATDTALAITATATTANPYMLLTTAFVIQLDALV